ncbi:hypothetical protein [Desulfobaculum bizertense]|uniref:Uncharacterized protein n=1 Tax=Desulfobaculum bizertense DSM 18034 TaxID=1121442 RepID=A0A1T4WQK9_9BACT|nr:hypothetical protein [Desulfobaculum bizertense]UIJ37314.1 hypothetical protein LWC08_11320 [Desulfobaculum bizertense]SKA79606.1 hypothetical protein SAMN02745702_02548 [Desulfobaculum bizertense DSM 18034]
MDKALSKMARQLLAYDEASLTSLWDKYAKKVEAYEPTQQWEEAVIILSMIQAVRFKNQLFNFHWKEMSTPDNDAPAPKTEELDNPFARRASTPSEQRGSNEHCKLLRFRPRKND